MQALISMNRPITKLVTYDTQTLQNSLTYCGVSDTEFFVCEVCAPDRSMACPNYVHPISGHHKS